MSSFKKILSTLLLTVLFVVLFYDRDWGFNMYIFQLMLISLPLLTGGINWSNNNQKTLLITSFLMSTAAFVNHSVIAFLVSWLSVGLFAVSLSTAKSVSMYFMIPPAIFAPFEGIYRFVISVRAELAGRGFPVKKIWRMAIYAGPAAIIVLFLAMYSNANPAFGKYTASMFSSILNFIELSLDLLDWLIIGLSILGFLLSVAFLYSRIPNKFIELSTSNNGLLNRQKSSSTSKKHLSAAVRQENKTGVFLLVVLNVMLLILLTLEVKDVWFGFDYNGAFLKEFVHEGMYILILSIFISMGIVLFYFRGNQNFFSGSKWLKRLTYLWIGLNAVLVLSVAIRNFWYIEYFALAYKRIGLMFFLVATLIGLWSIYKKVEGVKNTHYLLTVNSLSVYMVLCLMAVFNWDVIIAKYNFGQSRAMVELSYMSQLSDKSLPYLVQTEERLEKMQDIQKEQLSLSSSSFERHYETPADYNTEIDERVSWFKNDWENKDWLEWNPAQYRAFNKLGEMD
ncbi:DUF4153 domain-containing protein [Salibacter halophilus]|uniref:DUF4173 domain-containing protein n=1 Tax=Salibacter halophilus TaxID=1803916 RepID=A0A6N6MAY2_9FLAO|nr:DUF4173 domain-containing protein [Salibacter halophilus]KAB1065591.1 DUF4173 domain-containing protein [Salibacter halophilus]